MAWDESFDVVVIGSGLAGLSAALAARLHGLSAVIVEKAPKVGGGTSYSTGGLWIGNNKFARAENIADSRDETLTYMRFLSAGYEVPDHMLAFIDHANEALDHFHTHGIPFQLVRGLPDHYYDAAPGSKPQGRMIEVALCAGPDLGAWRDKVETSLYLPAGITFNEIISWGGRGNAKNWDPALLKERAEAGMMGLGVGLVGHFLKALIDAEVPVRTSCAADRLVMEDGVVAGLIVKEGEQEIRLRAARGVVIASGGYESSPQMVREYEGVAQENWQSMFSSALTGDGLMMGAEVGAKVLTLPLNMSTFLGFRVPGRTPADPASYRPASVGMTSFPHTVIVNKLGERFGDESYFQAIVNEVRHFDVWRHSYPNMPCFVIFDQNYADKYSFNGAPAGAPIPPWVARADTLADLARSLDIDPAGFEAAMTRFNEHAHEGRDPDFQRGDAAWAKLYAGDLTHTLNPNLGPVDRPPYYGVRLVLSGASSAGLLTDGHGQVMHVRGHPIRGLFASGNASACTDFGAGYQAGESLARGMSASYLAVKRMVGKE